MSPGAVEVTGDLSGARLLVHWTDGRSAGSCRFDRLAGTSPEWLGSADELLEGTSRSLEGRVLGAVTAFATEQGLDLGIWHDDAGVELLA